MMLIKATVYIYTECDLERQIDRGWYTGFRHE